MHSLKKNIFCFFIFIIFLCVSNKIFAQDNDENIKVNKEDKQKTQTKSNTNPETLSTDNKNKQTPPDREDALASDLAEQDGVISINLGQYPKSFNYTIDHSQSSDKIFGLMFENLTENDSKNLSDTPSLAKSWSISEDKLEFTFHIDREAKWSDGKSITADDVIWSFNAYLDKKHLTGPLKVVLGKIKKVEKIDELTVKFTAKKVHWKNFIACSSFYILPKHWWEKQEDFNKINFKFDVVSGPYKINELKEQHYVRLKKRQNYWAKDKKRNKNINNFEEIEFRFYTTRNVAYEAFKKKKIDLFAIYTASRWVKETHGDKFEKNWITKQKVYNYNPIGFQGFAMNMRKAPFKDKNVRLALAHLLDRKRMNNSIMFNQYKLMNSFYPDLWNDKNPCPNLQIDFNPEKAKKLLNSAGWKINEKSGILEKNGQKFVIKFLTRSPSSNKFLHIYSEELKNIGIILKIEQKDWAAWMKDMDEYNYDMTWAAWGASIYKDPEPMWHSKHSEIKAGSNITGFKNQEVDKLIEKSTQIFDIEERHNIIRKIDTIITQKVPYVLLWNIDYTRLLYWNKFGMPDHVLGKYEDEFAVLKYWWVDPDQSSDLEDAIKDESPLPSRSNTVKYNDFFK